METILTWAVRDGDLPAALKIIVLVDDDSAGERGTVKTTQRLATCLNRPVYRSKCPERAKDLRTWLNTACAAPNQASMFALKLLRQQFVESILSTAVVVEATTVAPTQCGANAESTCDPLADTSRLGTSVSGNPIADTATPCTSSDSATPPSSDGVTHSDNYNYNAIMRLLRAEHFLACRRANCIHMRVSSIALDHLGIGYYPAAGGANWPTCRIAEADLAGSDFIAFPIRDVDDHSIGIHLCRVYRDEDMNVGGHGLIGPENWDDYPGIVYVVETVHDVAALLTIGVCAIALSNPVDALPALTERLGRISEPRGVIVVGPANWASEIARLIRAAGIELAWWNSPPDGYPECYGWVYDRVPGVAEAAGLLDLGNELAGALEAGAAEPGGVPTPVPSQPKPAPVIDLPELAARSLMPDPAHAPFLSEAARARSVVYQEEIHAAHMAAWAAECGDAADTARWVEVGKWMSTAAEEHAAAAERVARRQPAATAPAANLEWEPPPYKVDHGRICKVYFDGDGAHVESLCNFHARIAYEVVHDDGAETTTYFRIEGQLQDGTPLDAIEVRADEYADMDWVTAKWGARPIIDADRSARSHIRAAIQRLSGTISRRIVYGHTGWRQIDDRWHYLHAGGAIGSDGIAANVAVRLPTALERYRLPSPPTTDSVKLVEAIRTSLGLLNSFAPDRIVFPVYASVWRAVVGGADMSLAINGLTGTFKSETAALALQHFGASMDRMHLPANWASTANALEGIAHAAKDAILVIDDFCPPATPAEAARYHTKADQVMRGAGNGAGRQRMRADTTLRPEKPPRCLILSTGEESPRGQSLQARMFQMDLASGDVKVERLTECQRDANAGLYAVALAGFTRWLAPQYGVVRRGLHDEVEEKRDLAYRKGQHRRTSSIVAELTVGLSWFLRFAYQAGAITTGDVRKYEERCLNALGVAADRQTEDQGADEPTGKFLRLLAAAIASGRAHVAAPDGSVPNDGPITVDAIPDEIASAWGWRVRVMGGGAYEREDWQAQGPCVGWVDEADLYLEPDASYATAQAMARDQNDGLAIGARTLRKRLKERKLLVQWEPNRGPTVRKALGGVKDRPVLHLRVDTLVKAIQASGPKPDCVATNGNFEELLAEPANVASA